jgi:type I restriction enzyme S subunit
MKATDFRKSIFQAAVQGKLVPQDKSDEPASVLLKRIQAEKAKLIKEGKLKKEKPLPPITEDEVPYDLPEGWAWCRLSSAIIDIFTGPFGSMLHKADYVENGIPLVNPMNIVNEALIPSKRMMVDEKTRDRLSSYILSDGDIVIARRGELGRCAIVTSKETGWLCGTGSFFVKLSRDIYARYFTLVFRSTQTLNQLNESSVGTTMSNLNHEILKSVLISVPPLAEQQRIVAKVDEIMVLCDELEAAEKELDTLETHFAEYLPKSILRAAVQGKLVPQDKSDEPASELLKRIRTEKTALIKEGKLKKEKTIPPIAEDESLYDLPQGWAWCRLGDFGNIVGGSTPSSINDDFYTDAGKGLPWITPADMKINTYDNVICRGQKDITQAGFASCSTNMLPKGSVVYSSRAPIGLIAFAGNDLCTNQGFKSFVPAIMDTAMWAFIAMKSFTDSIIQRATGTTFLEVSGSFMERVAIPVPPLAEQQRIVAKVDELMALCDELKHVGEQPIDHNKVIQFLAEAEVKTEPLKMAAQGKVSEQPSKKHATALDDLVEMMDDD